MSHRWVIMEAHARGETGAGGRRRISKRAVAALAVALALAAPAPARADGPSRWYGGWIASADLLSIVTLTASPQWLSVGTYVLVPPLIHVAKHHGAAVAPSLLLRLALPVGGGLVGGKLLCEPSPDEEIECLGATVLGGVVGVIAASTIDIALLAHAPDEDEPALGVSFAPRPEGGGMLVVAGQF